jgi:DNA repair exonuclease SbcCD ATPase subunit
MEGEDAFLMTITEQPPATTAGGGQGACRYPGCGNPARDKDAPGRRPGYCELEVPEDRDGTAVLVRHTALTAFRRRRQLAGQPGEDRPVTTAISRAGAIRDDALAAMSRLGAQLAAALDQLAVLGEQLAAAGPEAAEAQAEAVRAETAARLEHARAETAGHAAARHAAELDAAEARAAAAEAVAMLEEQAAARERAEEASLEAARALEGERASHAAELAAALGAARDAVSGQEQERRRHDDALTAVNATVTALREQLARTETALDRERDRQHETVALLRGLIPGPDSPAGKTPARRQPAGQ